MVPRKSLSIVIALVGLFFKDVTSILPDSSFRRNITFAINPGCHGTKCSNFTLVYLQQHGERDILHHLWTMEKIPTFVYARTPINTNLIIDWEKMSSGNMTTAISFSTIPDYYAAVLIPRFFVFNDFNDTASLPEDWNDGDLIEFACSKMIWDLKLMNQTNNVSVSAVFQLRSFKGIILDDTSKIQIGLTLYGDRGRSSILPHLAFTENSTQIDFVFGNVPLSNYSFINTSRLAVEIAMSVSEDNGSFSLNISRSLDDEYTPGVFRLTEVRSPSNNHWMQWRPVCYTSLNRDIGDSTGLYETSIKNLTGKVMLDDTIISRISPLNSAQTPFIEGFIVSFGVEGDGFYNAYNYTAWTIVTGHGQPLEEEFSLMVILVMAIGLGLPAVVLILGGIGIAFRNYKKNKDDLLLSN